MEARDRMIFELGGTSLNAVLFSSSLHHETGIALGLDAIYQYPTLEELADAAVQ